MVAGGQITDIDELLKTGRPVLETQIIDSLLPDLKEEVLEVTSTQRMTAYGRKQAMRSVVILGNRRGYIAIGVGKAAEARDAIAEAITDAKKHVVKVSLGCGSWECGCGGKHSITQKAVGKSSSTKIEILPAPKGVGIVAGDTARQVLQLAGVSDCWTFSKGRTRSIINTVLATINALESLNKLKKGKEYQEPEPAHEAPALQEEKPAAAEQAAQPTEPLDKVPS